ncbi:MAG: hypothetical protein QXV32_01620 [Conexivisphaerales archaeon]
MVVAFCISLASNIYFIAENLQNVKEKATGVVTLNILQDFTVPIEISSAVTLFEHDVTLNGTALVTGYVSTSAPVNFMISYLGPEGPYAFRAFNITTVNVRVLLPEATWCFVFTYAGVNSIIYTAQFELNYSYLTWPPT